MSDSTSTPSNKPTDASLAPSPQASKTPKPKTPGRWRRRAWYAFWIILALAIVLRLVLIFAFPVVLRKVAAHYGFDCTYERTEFYLLDSDMGIWHLKITPKSGGDPLLDAEYCRADVSALNLLRGRLVVRRVEADGVDINVGRNEKGEFPALQSFLQSPHTAAATTQKTAAASKEGSLSLDSPLKIDALRLNHVRTRLRDRSVNPPTDATLETTIRLSDLGSDIRPTKFLMDLASNPFLDAMRIEGEGTSHGQSLQANFSLSIRGLHPKPAAGYLLPLGTRGDANDISVHAGAKIEIAPTTKPSQQNPQTTPSTQPIDLTADALISNVSITADGVEAAGIDRIALDVPSFNQGAVHVAALVIDGVRAHALRSADAKLHFAGMELAPVPPARATQSAPAASSEPPMQLPKKWVIDLLALRHLNVGFRDESITPAADLSLTSDDIHVKKIVADPAHPEAPVEIAGLLTSPGMARSITLSGSATPFAAKKAVQIKLLIEGIKPDAIKGYLDAAGLESQFKSGTLACDLDASGAIAESGAISADAHFGHIKLSDDKDLFAFDGVTIAGVAVDPKATKIRAESIEISGPHMSIARDATGALYALGFKTKPPIPAGTSLAPSPKAAAVAQPLASHRAPAKNTAPAAAPPIIEIGKLAWNGIDIHFDDQAIAPANSFVLNDAGLELTDLHLDLAGKSAPPAPGKLRGWFSLPGVAGKLTVDGTIVPQTDAMSADLTVTGKGLDATRLATYAKPFGIEPTLKNGSLQLHAQAKVGTTDKGLYAALAVTDFHYADGEQKLVDAAALRVDGLGLQPGAVSIDSVQIDKPFIRIAREKDGELDAAGIRIPAPSTQPAPQAAPVAAAPPPTTTKAAPGAPPPPAMVATLTKLRINDASLQWQDAAVATPVDALAHATVSLDNFVVGKDSPPAKLSIAAKVDQTIDSATIAGTVLAAPTKQQAQLAINATGIKAGVLASYLPPNIQSALKDGRAQLNLDAGIADNPAGGISAHLLVDNLDYRDAADAPKPLFHLDAAHVLASRIDVPGNIIAVDEISVAGLETEAHLTADGKTNVLGLTILPASAGTPASQPAVDASPAPSPSVTVAVAPTTASAPDLNQMIAARKAKAPLITLEKLDVQLKRIAVVDDAHPDAAPLVLHDFHLHNLNRIEMLGDDALNRPPAAIELTGGVDPLVQNFTVQTKIAPFASPATLDVVINADGIHGEGLTQAMPDLAKTIDGKPLADGKFEAHLEAQAKITRRGPAAYDLAEPFEISFLLHDVALKNGDAPQTLVGLQEIRADAIRVNPTTGDVIIHALEINKPIASILRDTAGIHIAGLILKESPATQPASAATTTLTPSPGTPGEGGGEGRSATAIAPGQRPKSEFRIDKLLMSGIDVRIEDTTTAPPLIVPLAGLEVEARGLSNLAPYQDLPIQFNALINAGKVPIEGGKEQELFSEIAASGKLGLYPKPNGWVKTTVSGFEVLGLYGPAKANKVTIGGGVFDANVDLRFQNNGDIDTRSKFMFTDLKLSEPPDGPIRSFLKLPSPVDAVIVVLQDQDGTITAPLNVPIKDGQVSTGQIAGQAVGAFGAIVTTAIASAPLKVAGGVGSVLGMGKDKEKEHSPQIAADIHFPAGVADIPVNSKDIASVIDQLRRDSKLKIIVKQELSQADVERAAQRANPTPAEAAALAAQLRQRKEDLLALRQTLAPQAEAMLTANSGSAGPATVARLRAIDRDLAATENGLDTVYDLLRPGADRQADRRTRAAAIAIGDARLQTINDALLASNLPGIKDRIQLTHSQFNPAENADQPGHVTLQLQEVK